MGVKSVIGENKKYLLLVVALLIVSIGIMFALNSGLYGSLSPFPAQKETYAEPEQVIDQGVDYKISIKTNLGDILIDLYEDRTPENVNSILFLASERYYEGLTFYKVVRNFVIQTGDAQGDGNGNPGYTVGMENTGNNFEDYSVGMANASQFFIVLPGSDKNDFNGKYSMIGKVITGTAVVDSIAKVEVDDNYKPLNDVVIESILIIE